MKRYLLAVVTTTVFAVLLQTAPALAQSAVRTGEITKITAENQSFTVKTARGETNILTTSSTVITEGDKKLTFKDLKVGDSVKVSGVRKDADVEAQEIQRQPK